MMATSWGGLRRLVSRTEGAWQCQVGLHGAPRRPLLVWRRGEHTDQSGAGARIGGDRPAADGRAMMAVRVPRRAIRSPLARRAARRALIDGLSSAPRRRSANGYPGATRCVARLRIRTCTPDITKNASNAM